MTPRYLIDANIILDALLQRDDEPMEAARLLDLGYRKKARLLVTPMALGFVLAMLQKKRSAKKPGPKLSMVRAMMHDLLLNVEVIPATRSNFIWSLNSDFHDFEDGATYAAGMGHCKLDGIVTRDEDFKGRTTPPLFKASEALSDWAKQTKTKGTTPKKRVTRRQ